jgi:histone acetyltransferase
MQLIDATNIFSRQLPNMGTGYILRLVFDVTAATVCLLHNGRTAGGICSKFFMKEEFLEIVFLCVESAYQARGYGRLLMNHLKHYLQHLEIFDILTCADNDAVTYFRKQGFNRHEILMDPARWIGCIKDYEGVTLVHCRIRPDVDYIRFASILREQQEFLKARTGMGSFDPGEKLVPSFVPFKQSPAFVNVPIPEILERYQPVGGSCMKCNKKFREEYAESTETLREKLMAIVQNLKSVPRFALVFGRPVTEEKADGYFEKTKRPMDFLTIEKRLTRYPDYYKRPEIFAADIQLMCDNCKQFNSPDTTYYRYAVEVFKRFRDLYEEEFSEFPLY